MSKAKIFLVGDSEKKLIPMEETPYEAEHILQSLLADYPDLIPGDQINPGDPRQWLLVKREAGVPGDEQGSNVWSLDHLFLDQEGRPTLIECKRASDTRIRREVVAQMLDYAANGTQYWPIDRLRQDAAETARSNGTSLDEQLMALTGRQNEDEIEEYWQIVEKNLREGIIRLVFVADEIPRELVRLIEFMNDKMADIEVLGVEIKQYLGGDRKAVVPRVIGFTEKARQQKQTSTGKTTQGEFFDKLDATSRAFFEKLFNLANQKGFTIYWGTKGFSVRSYFQAIDKVLSCIYGYPTDKFEIWFKPLIDNGIFSSQCVAEIGEKLESFKSLQKRSGYYWKTTITAANADEVLEAYRYMLDKMLEVNSKDK
jgi:hypothetical protein